MIFRICEDIQHVLYRKDVVCLQPEESQSRSSSALFHATYFDDCSREFPLGPVRIGMHGMPTSNIRKHLSEQFISLPDTFISLGQSEDYYENIKSLGDAARESMLDQLKDLAFHGQWPAERSEVLELMLQGVDPDRTRALEKVNGQFRRMAHGRARLTKYHFSYTAPKPKSRLIPPVSMTFDVTPSSKPPTNIHALIGRNGCGKTFLIKHMVQCLQDAGEGHGEFLFEDENSKPIPMSFANVVCIAFSPFDNFAELLNAKAALPSKFIGLDKDKGDLLNEIRKQFLEHFQNCLVTEKRRSLWKRAIETLQSDPTFSQEQLDSLMDDFYSEGDHELSAQAKEQIQEKFDQLSSGHKVVLLIVTGCVAEVEERTIVFLDEPENHLHPPLLSALVRALSDLLMDRNGVAIVSTHSPVVLQEIPKSCVYLLTRYGQEYVKPERLDRETFGSSLGCLIDDAFAFEVNNSGFHKMMVETAAKYDNYPDALAEYGGHLGDEARILLRMLIRMNAKGG